MTFKDQLKALVYFQPQEHSSAQHLIQDLKDNYFAKEKIACDERSQQKLKKIIEILENNVVKLRPSSKHMADWQIGRNELEGKCVAGRILVFPVKKGSATGSWQFYAG